MVLIIEALQYILIAGMASPSFVYLAIFPR